MFRNAIDLQSFTSRTELVESTHFSPSGPRHAESVLRGFSPLVTTSFWVVPKNVLYAGLTHSFFCLEILHSLFSNPIFVWDLLVWASKNKTGMTRRLDDVPYFYQTHTSDSLFCRLGSSYPGKLGIEQASLPLRDDLLRNALNSMWPRLFEGLPSKRSQMRRRGGIHEEIFQLT